MIKTASRDEAQIALRALYGAVARPDIANETVELLASVAAFLWNDDADAGRPPARFREVTPAAVKAELTALARGQADLTNLHEPTVIALAAFGVTWHPLTPPPVDVMALAAQQALTARLYLPRTRRRSVDMHIDGRAGNKAPANNRAAAARKIFAAHWRALTGKRPTVSGRMADHQRPAGGAFLEFLSEAYAAINLTGSAEGQATRIAYGSKIKPKT